LVSVWRFRPSFSYLFLSKEDAKSGAEINPAKATKIVKKWAQHLGADLGAEKFCEVCLKCGESCPSKSIPIEREKKVDRGIERWSLNAETCFAYWGKIGTDCCICMAICPFSRPNRTIHRFVKFMLRTSALARVIFPYIDNILYGRRWRPRKALDWMDYPKGASSKEVPIFEADA
jgi:ferredoxin